MGQTSFEAGIKAVNIKCSDEAGSLKKTLTITFERPFDIEMARAIGQNALDALHVLKNGLKSGVMLLDALNVDGRLTSKEKGNPSVDLDEFKLVKANLSASEVMGGEDADPTMVLVATCKFTAPVWAFLGKHVSTDVEVVLDPRQQTLPGMGGGDVVDIRDHQQAARADEGEKEPDGEPPTTKKKRGKGRKA